MPSSGKGERCAVSQVGSMASIGWLSGSRLSIFFLFFVQNLVVFFVELIAIDADKFDRLGADDFVFRFAFRRRLRYRLHPLHALRYRVGCRIRGSWASPSPWVELGKHYDDSIVRYDSASCKANCQARSSMETPIPGKASGQEKK